MVFNYLNDGAVWKKSCDTYEALYELFSDFDTYYSGLTGFGFTPPPLQQEWKEFIEVVLTSMVERSKATLQNQMVEAVGYGALVECEPPPRMCLLTAE